MQALKAKEDDDWSATKCLAHVAVRVWEQLFRQEMTRSVLEARARDQRECPDCQEQRYPDPKEKANHSKVKLLSFGSKLVIRNSTHVTMTCARLIDTKELTREQEAPFF